MPSCNASVAASLPSNTFSLSRDGDTAVDYVLTTDPASTGSSETATFNLDGNDITIELKQNYAQLDGNDLTFRGLPTAIDTFPGKGTRFLLFYLFCHNTFDPRASCNTDRGLVHCHTICLFEAGDASGDLPQSGRSEVCEAFFSCRIGNFN